jgi:transposase
VEKSRRYLDNAWLTRKYSIEQLSMGMIAKECGVDPRTIYMWVKRHKIHRRTRADAAKLIRDHRVVDATHNANITYRSKEWLEEQRKKKGLTVQKIAEMCCAAPATIDNWLKTYKLNSKKIKQGRKTTISSFSIPQFMDGKIREFCRIKRTSRSRLIKDLLIEAMLREGIDPYGIKPKQALSENNDDSDDE